MAKMTRLFFIVLGYTALIGVNAAPSENLAKTEDTLPSGEVAESLIKVDEQTKNTEQGNRQKRWNNFYGYGLNSNPQLVSSFDQAEEPFLQIYRKLKDISSYVKTPAPPAPVQFPIYIPVLFVPQPGGCRCRPNTSGNGTVPVINTRFPPMEDTRQNWGIDDDDTDDTEEYNRPVSFTPIPPPQNAPPAPPVDHGSSQADANAPTQRPPMTTTTSNTNNPVTNAPRSDSGSKDPTMCDAAVLSCCQRSPVTRQCFLASGCDDISQLAFTGTPCTVSNILSVITKYQRFYSQRTG